MTALSLGGCSGEASSVPVSTPAATSAQPVSLGEPVAMHLVVRGMHCDGCEGAICSKVLKVAGVTSVVASHVTESVEVLAPPEQRDAVIAAITRLGYKVGEGDAGEAPTEGADAGSESAPSTKE